MQTTPSSAPLPAGFVDRSRDPAVDVVRRIGDIEVIAICDGVLPSRVDVALGIELSHAERLTGVKKGEKLWMSVNQFLVRLGDKRALIDTGAADRMYPSLGLLPQDLRRRGLDPAEIDYVFLTHLHPDHMYGLVAPDGAATFPRAEVFIHEREANFWIGATPDTGKPNVDKNIIQTERHLRDYRDRLRIVRDGEVMANVSVKCCPGHTPGHSAWIIHSGREAAMMWGDIIHLQHVQMQHTKVATTYDLDGESAARSRQAILDMCATDGLMALGAHLEFPGFARVTRRSGEGFALEADG